MQLKNTDLRRITIPISAGVLHARCAGPEDGTVVILLHGFPEFWYGWRNQIGALASAGYRVVAVDQRGYNESSKPATVGDYALSELRSDVIAVADALGQERVCLAGHDWGGIVAWEVGMQNPERLSRMVILNVPHPAAARRFLTSSPRQMLRSWYVLFFQLPGIPERFFSARGFEAGVQALTKSSRAGAFTEDELQEYKRAWAQPGALTGMINWYRALVRYSRREDLAETAIRVPTRILWGKRDEFLLPELASASLKYCGDGDLVEFESASHWLHHEEPDRVNAAMIEWFKAVR